MPDHIQYDSGIHLVLARFDFAQSGDAPDGTAYATTVGPTLGEFALGLKYDTATGRLVPFVPPLASFVPAIQSAYLRNAATLAERREAWYQQAKQRSANDGTASLEAAEATAVWLIHLAGFAYGVAAGLITHSSWSDDDKRTIIQTVIAIDAAVVKIWYGVMTGNNAARDNWKSWRTLEGNPIYQDIVASNGAIHAETEATGRFRGVGLARGAFIADFDPEDLPLAA